jgi:hypothetical protein
MAIILKTKAPDTLVDKIRLMIDDGIIDTWSYDDDGDLTHIGQWKNKAWFTPKFSEGQVKFALLGRKNVNMTLMEYSVYHGRFVELLLNHFQKEIEELVITKPLEDSADCNHMAL